MRDSSASLPPSVLPPLVPKHTEGPAALRVGYASQAKDHQKSNPDTFDAENAMFEFETPRTTFLQVPPQSSAPA